MEGNCAPVHNIDDIGEQRLSLGTFVLKSLTPQWVAVALLKSKIKDHATHTTKPTNGSITVSTATVRKSIRPPYFPMITRSINKMSIKREE